MARALAVLPALALSLILTVAKVNGGCFLERGVSTNPGEHDVYTCVRSNDFEADLARLPLNSTKQINIVFRESKLPKLKKEAFAKLGAKALGISIVHCGLEEIDDEAFKGLTELKGLILRRNRIATVKKTWFSSLAKLESLDLSQNLIREFDPSIFETTPQIQEFEISENLLTKFDIDAMKAKWPKLKKVGLQSNPYTWDQGVKIIEYSNQNPSLVKNSYVAIDGIRDTYKVVKECQASITKKDDPKELDICVQNKLAKAIEYPKILEGDKATEAAKTS
ncbi:hypothetical protein QAD02_004873 [Eretmocerus hayati]|uniref:Uncharacterized protein n=1 Tax=Eretmocerus hayati TaxID=131215 RepID=A0ACC2NR60_9HYME|nr:hypothetical protein QAD02_004873 [Eretmocerus hayati]